MYREGTRRGFLECSVFSSWCWLHEFVRLVKIHCMMCVLFCAIRKKKPTHGVLRIWAMLYGNTCFMFLPRKSICEWLEDWLWSWGNSVWIRIQPLLHVSAWANYVPLWASVPSSRCFVVPTGSASAQRSWIPQPSLALSPSSCHTGHHSVPSTSKA